MAAVAIQGVSRQFGTQVVVADISLELQPRETVGLIGANGAGKTTLFRLITGELPPDKGTITRARGLEIGFLRQEPDISLDRTLHDEVGSVFAELLALEEKMHSISAEMAEKAEGPELAGLMQRYERLNAEFITAGGHKFEARMNEILGGLGFAPSDYLTPLSVMSGGQKCRAALAKLLLQNRTFLLLDEPTNHLDIDAVRWLEKYLAAHHGGAVIVSHDRYLLDRLCDRIVEIEHARVTSYPGNYTNYAKVKELRLLTQQRQYEKDSEFIKKEQQFIEKHIYSQRGKEARGRRTRLQRRLEAGEFVTEKDRSTRTARIKFDRVESGDGVVLRCDELSMAYDDNVLFEDLTFQVPAGGRFGITGPNGTGKTTLLNIILGQVDALGGGLSLRPRLTVGYYSQEHTQFDPNRTIVDEIRDVRTDFSEQDARSHLALYLFTGDDVFKTLGMLSGGEQSRVRLAKLILRQPQLLVLDEPTNHLDIPSREVLEDTLSDFGGTIIVVSHDRYFLDRIVDRLLVLRREGHAIYEGNYSYYIQQVEEDKASAKGKVRAAHERKKKQVARDEAKKPGPSPYDRLSIDELESMVIEHETKLAALHERFADSSVYRDPEILAELQEELEAVETELAEIDAAWQERVESQ
ncbi:MAG: ABC-F family ATP-binding cassette domain-containing protein [Phycisphaerales bacterium]|nr:MAG: ABC-F family ATP-binding cassette domain-containing protein [Phycisphaerales bacterium]